MAATPYRVLHLIHSKQRRGAEVFAVQLASQIERNGRFKNAVCSLYAGDDGLAVGELPAYKLDSQPGLLNKMGVNPQLTSRLLGALREFKPNVLVAHGSDTLKYGACAGALYRKASTIYRNIGTASVWANSSLKVNFNRLLLKQMDAVVSVSQFTRQDFVGVYRLPEAKVTYIPNGVDATGFDSDHRSPVRTRIRQELGVSQTDIALISVGNLSNEKGHLGLLPIVRDLAQSGTAVHLVLVGDGPLRQDLAAQTEQLGIADRVHILGRRTDVAQLMESADLMVLPSKTGGMPAVLIEAGMSDLPTVAFDVGGVKEVIENGVTGVLVAPQDYCGLQQVIADLCQNPNRRNEMGRAARVRCAELFSMRRVAGEYESLFLKVLNNDPGERYGQS